MTAIPNTDYLASSTRVRALENGIIGKEKCERLLEAKTRADAYHVLEENGVKLCLDEEGRVDAEETFSHILQNAYQLVCEIAPQPAFFAILQYPYDCHNLKAAIKCAIRERDCAYLLFSFGSISAEKIAGMVRERVFNGFPRHMAKAAENALEAYAKTSDPQQIDVLLDHACYEDMLEQAKKGESEFFLQLVRRKIDTTNIMIAIRLSRMASGQSTPDFVKRMLLSGGLLSESFLVTALEGGEANLYEKLRYTDYTAIAVTLEGSSPTLAEAERVCEDFYMDSIRKVKYQSCGAAVLAAYLIAREYEVKNIRIIFAGKAAGLPTETIRERLRASYV